MKVLIDSLYFGSIWRSIPEVSYDGELITSVKYKVEKVSDTILFKIVEDQTATYDMKLSAYSIASGKKFSLQPSLSCYTTYIVNPNELKSLRQTFPDVEFPICLDQCCIEDISKKYDSISARAKMSHAGHKEVKESMTKELKRYLKNVKELEEYDKGIINELK